MCGCPRPSTPGRPCKPAHPRIYSAGAGSEPGSHRIASPTIGIVCVAPAVCTGCSLVNCCPAAFLPCVPRRPPLCRPSFPVPLGSVSISAHAPLSILFHARMRAPFLAGRSPSHPHWHHAEARQVSVYHSLARILRRASSSRPPTVTHWQVPYRRASSTSTSGLH